MGYPNARVQYRARIMLSEGQDRQLQKPSTEVEAGDYPCFCFRYFRRL